MAMLVGLFGLVLLIVAIGAVVILIMANVTELPSVHVGAIMLDCPHCGRETPSHLEFCQFCGKSFRDTVIKAVSKPDDSPTAATPQEHG
jgi:hypothetical protein